MTLTDIIAALQIQITALQAILANQTQFTQSDIDAAVAAAVAPLNAQIVDLTAQVAAMPGTIHQAVLAEDQKLAAQIKPILDALTAAT